MALNYGQLKELVADYNYGKGMTNMQLARKYGITASTVRNKLISEGVYKDQRGKKAPQRSAAWQLTHAERLLKRVIGWHESGEIGMPLIYRDIKDYFKDKNNKQHERTT